MNSNLKLPQRKPLPKPYEIYIEFHEKIYKPGDTVTGNVHLSLRKKLTCDIVQAQLRGIARVLITNTELSHTSNSLTKNVSSSQELNLIDTRETLWKSKLVGDTLMEVSTDELARFSRSTTINTMKLQKPTNMPGIEAGEHDFPFSFKLPETGLATSFDPKHTSCSVKYSVVVTALYVGNVVLYQKELFPIVIARPLDFVPNALLPVDVKGNVLLSGHEILATLSLHKRGYTPGEPLQGTVEITNNSKKSVKYCCVSIVQKIVAWSSLPNVDISTNVVDVASISMPMHKISGNTQSKFELDYHIPALTPDFEIDACLKVSYELKLTVGLERKQPHNIVITLFAPLTIGTATIGSIDVMPSAPPDFDGSNNRFEDAPPSYDFAIKNGNTFGVPPGYDCNEKKTL